MKKNTEYTAYFEHTSGGYAHLPSDSQGFYDDFSVTVHAADAAEAEEMAMAAMYDDRTENHPEFVNRAVDDLVVRLFFDEAGERPVPLD